ncbi:hypothetical protein E1B28_009300 [Marasmius oreades]|uniref:Nephrocystin 3-like N-terminal domain-containing protein n=1 Tax=Marasmius oreades TaxID=181124 RepID=A0A9P7UU63_9AGAR|nr:uncharacterized protein E1B28_009300 [Marasmius oreades]KAG7093001.1 hypothetical protein E1B28_009300 [Marasmius oreades]
MSFKRNRNFQVNDSVVNDSSGNGNTFSTHVGDNFYHQYSSGAESGLSNLSSRVAFNALHDAEARYPQPNVLAGTREEIIGKLSSWCEDDSKNSRVYWVNGAAGVGKSAIAQALCEKYIQTGQLAAGFFFSRNDSSRDKLDPFVATIAHQLATSETLKPFMAPLIDHIIRSTPGIWHKSLEDQFRLLIQEPCAQVDPRNWAQLPRLVVIDGVDECIDVNSQKRLLQMIQNAAPTLPLDFLILSRPEPHISRIFFHEPFTPNPLRLALGDFAESVRADIKRYLCHEFARIRKEHWHTLDSSLQASWPGDTIIDQLVCKATGQFIYATTVTKYIDAGKLPVTPIQRLDVILHAKRTVNSSSPYPDLDLLYSQILQYCVHEGGKLREILRLIVSSFGGEEKILQSPFRLLSGSPAVLQSLWALEQLLDLSQGEAAALLSGLHSILDIPTSKTEKIFVLHASFSEFLLDADRADVYYVGTKLSSQEWIQLLIPCQIRMLSRYCIQYNRWPIQRPQVHGQPVEGVQDIYFGSLNLWRCLYTITLNDGIAAALNAFDPHLYLTTILHWNYECMYCPTSDSFAVSGFSLQDREIWDWRYHTIAVHDQISMFYSVYRLLKRSDKSSPSCIQDFFLKCRSFFRGFYVAFPGQCRNVTDTSEEAVKYILFACQLSISCLNSELPTESALSFISYSKSVICCSDPKWMIRVLPYNNEVAIPAGWDVKYIDPTEGRLLRRLLTLFFHKESWEPSQISTIEAFDSIRIEDWTYRVAQLDWEKTWITYLFGKLARSIQGKRLTSKVVFSEDEPDSECRSVCSPLV